MTPFKTPNVVENVARGLSGCCKLRLVCLEPVLQLRSGRKVYRQISGLARSLNLEQILENPRSQSRQSQDFTHVRDVRNPDDCLVITQGNSAGHPPPQLLKR